MKLSDFPRLTPRAMATSATALAKVCVAYAHASSTLVQLGAPAAGYYPVKQTAVASGRHLPQSADAYTVQ
jgi:hypothetical protein